MRKCFFTILIICLGVFVTDAKAQVTQVGNLQDLTILNKVIESNRGIEIAGQFINTEDLNGSPYLNEDFKSGYIEDQAKDKKIKGYLRYRIFDDVFEVKNNPRSDEAMVLKRSEKYVINIGTREFMFLQNLPIRIKGVNNGYVEVLVKDDNGVSLYKRITQDYSPAKKARSTYSSSQKAKLDNNIHYFISSNGNMEVIEAHKRKAADAFANNNEVLEDYIKENGLKFRGEEDEQKDLIQLVNYYNTL
ncbi:hypothetical protein [Mesonia aquimarina]|uniref:hypothetical protein n=1 Tax=Mesonia aquimarina TaxID=1504967 RepID=UPI000EF5B4A4|nr:hypothetical protein [Mesonia aquimarina]